MADPNIFANMNPLEKIGALLRGGYLRFAEYPLLASEHGEAPERIKEQYKYTHPELGFKRVDRSPLDVALNYAGAYDWGVRHQVDPEHAREMAFIDQLSDYMFTLDPARERDAVQDYYENLAGVEAGIRDRGRTPRDISDEAAAYATRRATAPAKYRKGGLAQYKGQPDLPYEVVGREWDVSKDAPVYKYSRDGSSTTAIPAEKAHANFEAQDHGNFANGGLVQQNTYDPHQIDAIIEQFIGA